MTSPHVTPHRKSTSAQANRIATALAVIGGGLGLLILTVVGGDGRGPLTLGADRPSLFQDEDRDEDDDARQAGGPRRQGDLLLAGGSQPPTTVPVFVPVATGGGGGGGSQPVTVVVNERRSGSTGTRAPGPRIANGPAPVEIQRFYSDTDHPTAGEATRFRWWAGDVDGIIRGFQVDFGDGNSDVSLGPDRCEAEPSDPVQERPPFEHTYRDPGRYKVVLTVYSSGTCGNGPTQSTTAELVIEVGVFGVSPQSEVSIPTG